MYDAADRATSKRQANGTRVSYTFDDAGRLTRLTNLSSSITTLSSFAYAYDGADNRMHVMEADGNRVTWAYDRLYQLLS
jgi:YD repeat-containing protein